MAVAQLGNLEGSVITVGACIVSADNKILSMGYNGFRDRLLDDDAIFQRRGERQVKIRWKTRSYHTQRTVN